MYNDTDQQPEPSPQFALMANLAINYRGLEHGACQKNIITV